MNKYIIFCNATGEIKGELTCSHGDVALNHDPETESWIVYEGNISYPAHVDLVTLAVICDQKSEQDLWNDADLSAKGMRSERLMRSDWTQLPDVPLETKQAWAIYRQALRDITAQEGYPFSIVWPVEPV